VYGELGWLKDIIGRLRFHFQRERKNNEYEAEPLQGLCTLHLKLLQNESILQTDGMNGMENQRRCKEFELSFVGTTKKPFGKVRLSFGETDFFVQHFVQAPEKKNQQQI